MRRLRLLLVLVVVVAGLAAHAVPALAAPPPANDARGAAQVVAALPATVAGTTDGATVEPGEASAAGSVWYRYVAPTAGRLSLSLAAGGDLEGTLEAYVQRRSTLTLLAGEPTDEDGTASVTIAVTAGQAVLVRVAQGATSAPGPFTLRITAAAPEVRPPGTALAAGGTTLTLERTLRPAAAFNVRLAAGRSYRVAVAPLVATTTTAAAADEDGDDPDADDEPTCAARVELFPPGTTSFDDGRPALALGCDGYALLTPTHEQAGRWLLRAAVPSSARGAQRLHLQLAAAQASDTAPGRYLDNHSAIAGSLQGSGANRIDLYRFQLRTRSALSLALERGGDELGLTLRTDTGGIVDTAEGGSLRRDLAPGRYFVSVQAPAGTDATYRLRRSSRTITRAAVALSGVARARGRLGQALTASVRVSPSVGGRVRLTFSRLDPVAGWQYLQTRDVTAVAGRAATAFRAPAVGRFRVRADYLGTRDAAPSSTGFASVLVTSG